MKSLKPKKYYKPYGHDCGIGIGGGHVINLGFSPSGGSSWRIKSAKDLSLAMLVTSTGGLACWFLYGLWIESLAIAVTNGVTCILAGTNLCLKLHYG